MMKLTEPVFKEEYKAVSLKALKVVEVKVEVIPKGLSQFETV